MSKTVNIVDLAQLRDAGLLAHLNEITDQLGQAGIVQHHSSRAVITTADATTDPTLVALAAAELAAYVAHIADTDAHVAADATNTVASAVAPTTQAEARDVINDLKIKINAHCILAAAHRGVPPYGGLLDTNATTDASAPGGSYVEAEVDSIAALATSLKTTTNRASAGKLITLVDGSDDATDYALANQIKRVLNRHFAGISARALIAP